MPKLFLSQKTVIIALLIGIFGLGFLITYLSLKISKIFVKNPFPTPNTFANATPAPLKETNQEKGVYNILLLGYGGDGHDGPLLTDSIVVVHVDTNTKRGAFLSIPRDLWTPGNQKINAVGLTNGFQNIGPVVQNITGLPINYFVSVDFAGFAKIIDDLGGITVNVPKTFDDHFFPITGQENNICGYTNDQINTLKAQFSGYNLETKFTCRYEHLHFDQGQINLDGATALKFVRSRHGDSDFGRSLRQFAVLYGIGNKLISLQAAGKFNDIVNTLSSIVKTDLDAGTIKSLIQILGDPKTYSLKQVQLTTDNVLNEGFASSGEYILYPKAGINNFTDIKTYVNNNIN